MGTVLLVARLVLALVFGVAGTAKAANLDATRRALVSFGVSRKLASPLRFVLPFVELAVAVALIPRSTAWLGAAAALALLLVFAGAIGVNLARGQKPDCNCFGQLQSKPVSWSVFARNLLLAAVAGVIVAQGKGDPGLSAVNWLADLRASEVANLVIGVAAVGLLATALVYTRRVLSQQATILERIEKMKKVIDEDYAEPPVERADAAAPLEGLPVGAPAPAIALSAIDGREVTLEDLLAHRKTVLLLFVSPNCLPCETLLPMIKVWERDYQERLTIALLSKGTLEENQNRVAKHGARHLLLQGDSNVADQYQARWTPAAVIVSPYGKIASLISYGDEAIRHLVMDTLATSDVHPVVDNRVAGNGHGSRVAVGNSSLRVGDAAPDFSVLDLRGKTVKTGDLLGRDTLLLFWDPSCPFCKGMSDDIRSWEANPPKGSPRLVFVASGEAEKVESESQTFRSRFLHDKQFDVGPLFGTSATPSAVLIDRDGRIASGIGTGSANVLALAGYRKVELPIASSF